MPPSTHNAQTPRPRQGTICFLLCLNRTLAHIVTLLSTSCMKTDETAFKSCQLFNQSYINSAHTSYNSSSDFPFTGLPFHCRHRQCVSRRKILVSCGRGRFALLSLVSQFFNFFSLMDVQWTPSEEASQFLSIEMEQKIHPQHFFLLLDLWFSFLKINI